LICFNKYEEFKKLLDLNSKDRKGIFPYEYIKGNNFDDIKNIMN